MHEKVQIAGLYPQISYEGLLSQRITTPISLQTLLDTLTSV